MPSAIIAEDEVLLRVALREALAQAWPELQIVAECEDGAGALEAIAEHAPDAAFLDIRMPGLTGLEVAAAAAETCPATRVVFTTAYDQYAVDAFERGAIDYLLKPILPERLAATVQRLKAHAAAGIHADASVLTELLRQLGRTVLPDSPPSPLTWITASTGRETRLIGIDEVLYFRAADKYTTVATADGDALLRTPVKDLLGSLDPGQFRQIHRSTIVNLRAIASVTRDDGGRGIVKLKSRQETLTVSQPFMALFRTM